jgi:hypothetical protein
MDFLRLPIDESAKHMDGSLMQSTSVSVTPERI